MYRNESDTSKCIPQKYTPGLLCTLFQVARLNSLAVMIFSSVIDPPLPPVTRQELSNQLGIALGGERQLNLGAPLFRR